MTRTNGTITCGIGGCSCGANSVEILMEVRWRGAQRDVLAGDIRGRVELEPLTDLQDLYGLGPLEGVKGEITILDSTTYIARVTGDNRVSVETGFHQRACFLVYSQIPRWRKVDLPDHVRDEQSLEQELPRLATEYGLDPSHPFPFLLRGQPDCVVFHVLNKTDDLLHSPEQHEKAKVKFVLEKTEVEIIGFHSHKHRGIFTPGHSSIHIHLKSKDGSVSGHVDTLSFPEGIDLFFPVVV